MALHATFFIVAAFALLLGPILYFTWVGIGEEVHQPGGDIGGETG